MHIRLKKEQPAYTGPIIDVHSHILAGLDDGASSMEQSLRMLAIARDEGIAAMFATPHLVCDGLESKFAARAQAALRELRRCAAERLIDVSLHLGYEVKLSSELPHMDRLDDFRLSGTKCLLLEPPLAAPPEDLEEAVYTIERSGMKTILAHPERCAYFARNFSALVDLAQAGVLLQVNAGSLTGMWGSGVERVARKLASCGLIHLIGSDAHSDGRRRPALREAIGILVSLTDQQQAAAIACHNAQRMFAQGMDTL